MTGVRATSAVRREEIIAAAVKLWARHGYHATSVTDLCEATGLGKGALYHHIGSKEEVLFEIHTRFVDPMLEIGREVLVSDLSARQKLERIGEELLELIARYQDYVTVFYREFNSLSKDRLQSVRAKRREFEQIIDKIIAEGVAAGEFRDLPVHLTTLAFLGMHNYTYAWFQPTGQMSSEVIARYFGTVFLDGLSVSPRPAQ
jgi:AcrR family transcriptional regulator